jgi:hypothetical protein
MSLRLAGLGGTLLIAGCSAAFNIPPKPEPFLTVPALTPSPSPSTLVVPNLAFAQLGAIVGDAACEQGPRHLLFGGFGGYAHVSFWVEGARPPYSLYLGEPGPFTDGRVFGAVLFGEGDVHDGMVAVDRTGGLGPTEDGGRLVLNPGQEYTWVAVADGTIQSYWSFVLPTRPCYSPVPSPSLAVNPAQPCDGDVLVISGDGFVPGPVHLEAMLRHLPRPGEIITGKEPPETHDLGRSQADASGHLAFEAKLDFLARRAWTLRAYDAGRTRLTTLGVSSCP